MDTRQQEHIFSEKKIMLKGRCPFIARSANNNNITPIIEEISAPLQYMWQWYQLVVYVAVVTIRD